MKNYLLLSLALMLTMPALADKAPMPSDAPKSYEAECMACHKDAASGGFNEKNIQVPAQ